MTQAARKHKDVSDFDSWTSKEFLPGAVVTDPGNSVLYITGGWRSDRPIWDKDVCTNCMLCWMHCPDSSILVKSQEMVGIDYDHCKGCGICVHECRAKALEMVPESDALAAEGGQ